MFSRSLPDVFSHRQELNNVKSKSTTGGEFTIKHPAAEGTALCPRLCFPGERLKTHIKAQPHPQSRVIMSR